MIFLKDQSEIINEGYFISEDTISIDLHKFESGESNILFIVGESGAGKSTLGNYFVDKYNCDHYDTDDCPYLKKEARKHWNEVEKSWLTFPKKHWSIGFKKCVSPKLKQKKKLVIAGGMTYQAYYATPSVRKEINKVPIIILGKSAFKAAIDRTRREYWRDESITSSFIEVTNGLIGEYRSSKTSILLHSEMKFKSAEACMKHYGVKIKVK